ncbi:hypothetical protein [Sphingobacterium sp. LRF_L2]|uniref:hypothetical protein n=1 Tax=Sphingobacterium sp. LRF_L2 TaxID=3369421 RepID=UPI003F645B65
MIINRFDHLYFFSCFIYSVILLFSSCSAPSTRDTQQKIDTPQYAVYILNKNNPSGFFLLDQLDSSSNLQKTAIPSEDFNREYIVKNNSLFIPNYRSNYFIRYELDSDNRFFAKDSLSLADVGDIENFHWVSHSDTLLLFSVKRENGSTGYLQVIDTKKMAVLEKHILPIPSTIKDYNILNIGVSDLVGNKLWLAYSYSKYFDNGDYTTLDTMYFSTIDMKNFRLLKTQKDNRSSYPGGINTVQTYSGKAENGDLYFMSCPGIALGNNLNAATAIFRKKNNSDTVDTNYMLNISEKIKNHAYGFWYIGEQKAIIRSERKDKYTDFSNHHSTHQFEYYLVDLATGMLEKISLPLDKGTRKENVLVTKNVIYLGIDDKDNNHVIWAYDINTKKIKKSIILSQSTDFILRLDKLK